MDGLLKTVENIENEEEFSFKKLFVPLTTAKAITWIVIIGFIVFANMLFNDFIGDDVIYILNDRTTHIFNLAIAFGRNNFNGFGQYRPISEIYFSLLYTLFGNITFYYHFLQFIFYTSATLLLYIFFRKFFPIWLSFILILVFLVHPMNVESASYIAQTDNSLFFILGMVPLLNLMKKNISKKTLSISLLLVLFSILTKETGVLFLIIIPIYLFLFNRKQLVKFLIGAGLIICIYAFIRFVIGHVYFEIRTLTPIADLPLAQRLINIPAIILYYLKTFFFPFTLDFNQQWIITSINFATFFLPLIIDLFFIFLLGLLGILVVKYQKKHIKIYILFLAWFLIGLLTTLQIFPLDMTVSDRWFYFPMVGLFGFLGMFVNDFILPNEKLKKSFILIAGIIILLLATRTIMRNTNFQNNIILLTHDSQIEDNFAIENSLGTEYKRTGNNDLAMVHIKKSAELRPMEINLLNLGILYEDMGDISKAKEYYKKAIQSHNYHLFDPHKHSLETYTRYASLLVEYDKPTNALPIIQEGIEDSVNYPEASELWLDLVIVKYEMHDKQGALYALNKYKLIDPQNEQISTLNTLILENKPITVLNINKTFIFKENN